MSVKPHRSNQSEKLKEEAKITKEMLEWAEKITGKLKDIDVQDFIGLFDFLGFLNNHKRKFLREFNKSLPKAKRIKSTALNKPDHILTNKILNAFFPLNEVALQNFIDQNYQTYGINDNNKKLLKTKITVLCEKARRISKNNIFQNSFNSLTNNVTVADSTLYENDHESNFDFLNENSELDDIINEYFKDEDEFRSNLSDHIDFAQKKF